MNSSSSTPSVKRVAMMALLALPLCPAVQAGAIDGLFASTNDAGLSHWTVSTYINGADVGTDSSKFLLGAADFHPAVRVAGRGDFIANNASGTNGGIGTYTQFVFRQQFDLTGYDPTTADLRFQWAADDSGEGFAARGTWVPQFKLNGGAFQLYPGPAATYDYGNTSIVTSGFVSGLNTIDFYVQGNGMTDGFALKLQSFEAQPSVVGGGPNSVPDTGSCAGLLALGCAAMVAFRRLVPAGKR